MRTCLTFLTLASLIGACARRVEPDARLSATCPMPPPGSDDAWDSVSATQFTGAFALVHVDTAPQAGQRVPPEVFHTRVVLAPADSAQRTQFHTRRFGHAIRRDLQLVGSWYVGESVVWPAEVDAGILYLGCRDCTDYSAAEFRVRGATQRGVWGTWYERDAGFSCQLDTLTGACHRLGDRAGYFCAEPLSDKVVPPDA